MTLTKAGADKVLSEDREALTLLLETSKAINSILDVDRLLEVVMDKVIEITRGDRGFLMLADRQSHLAFKVAKNFDRALLEGQDFKISRSVVEEVARTRKAVCSTNVLEDENIRNRKSVLELGLESVMCVPLVSKSGLIGIVYVDSHKVSAMFTEMSLQVFQALADHAAIAIENARLYAMAITDEKTGLYNHSHFLRRLASELDRADRYAESLSLLMIDLDHFKVVNDRYGHQAGDAVLAEVGRLLRCTVRSHDIAARYGGEEFALILPGGPIDAPAHSPNLPRAVFQGAVALAERLRRTIAGHAFAIPEGRTLQITVSIGCAHYPAEGLTTESQLIEEADRMLYEAKRGGRDRVAAPTEELVGAPA